MPTQQIIAPGIRGIDATADPLTLGKRKMAAAVNMGIKDGKLTTRSGFHYWNLGYSGRFKGACLYRPAMGLSATSFGHSGAQLAVSAGFHIYLNATTMTVVHCNPQRITPEAALDSCEVPVIDACTEIRHLFQAENYLIVQDPLGTTYWWDGTSLTASPGLAKDADPADAGESHDTFQSSKFRNWLANKAGLGIYAHGRIHQQVDNEIWVSDIIHKRGHRTTEDVLLMEEQSLLSFGDPLFTNSKMGKLTALEVAPQMGTSNGEGDLVGFYEGGVVTYNTFLFPRETRADAEGRNITNGWGTQRMVTHRLSKLSAVGRYAVCDLPRELVFRSPVGVHMLGQLTGAEVINDEPNNNFAEDVAAILNSDDPYSLSGTATGYWLKGQRIFITSGMQFDADISVDTYGRGFVVFNKAVSKTEDRTPVTGWEGVWCPDNAMSGVFWFSNIGNRNDLGLYGFLTSKQDGRDFYFATLTEHATEDVRDGEAVPIAWSVDTGRFHFGDLSVEKVIESARFEGIFSDPNTRLRFYVRSDRSPVWQRWREATPVERSLQPCEKLLRSCVLGKPPEGLREAAWFEFRIEGSGWAQINAFDVEITMGASRANREFSVAIPDAPRNYFSPQL